VKVLPVPPEPVEPFVPYDFRHLAAADDTYEKDAAQELLDIASRIAERRREALKLYEPLPVQEEFHASRTRIRLLRGSNRGGKTLPAAVECARIATNQDPHGKYPDHGTIFVVGKDWDHIGQVIYKKLFARGAFKIIQDRATGLWRAFRPTDPADARRRAEAKDAPPLIPKRFIKSIAWKEKKKQQPSRVELHNGWVIRFFTGLADPPQGEAVNYIWLDEEIKAEGWFSEMTVRLGDHEGTFTWSATPQNGTIQFYDLCQRADETRELDYRTVEQFVIRLADNPHITEKAKRDMEADLNDEQRRVRIEGDFSLGGQKIFGEFSVSVHGVPAFDVPADWTRYGVVDPGHQICACLFAAVPPPNSFGEGLEIVLYDELYIPASSAAKFGEAFARKCEGVTFESFVIDTRGSRITEAGSGRTVYEQYSDELKKRGVRSERTGHSFQWGCDMPLDGIERIRRYLAVQPIFGRPKLRVMVDVDEKGRWTKRLKNFHWEIERYLYLKRGDLVTDQPDEANKRTHLMACLRYLVMADPKWVPAARRQPLLDPAIRAFYKQQRANPAGPRHTHFGPPARDSA
jgi:hypothetical protein